jgi:hypothetical protein
MGNFMNASCAVANARRIYAVASGGAIRHYFSSSGGRISGIRTTATGWPAKAIAANPAKGRGAAEAGQTCRSVRDILPPIAAGSPGGTGQIAVGIGQRQFISALGGAVAAW